ncbi:MAG: polyprenyl synthetase family protein [Spirochaetes bacterium]|nr:polyprenyl synthetase family protein [Spirochaetota bacterium]
MQSNNSGLDPVYKHAGVRAELAYVRQIIDYLFAQEAAFAPLIEPALKNLSAASGKMLRPLMVLLGARAGKGSVCDYGAAELRPEALDVSILSRQTSNYLGLMQGREINRKTDGQFLQWKNQAAFPGGLPNRIYLLAAALEILHSATLVHDDVIDESPLRRGLPSAHRLLGNNLAVLLGDLLLTLCFALVNDTAETNTGSSHTGRLISGMVRVMVRSEFLQAAERQNLPALLANPGRRNYTRIISGKTAVLFALSLSSGAGEMGADKNTLDALRRAGYNMGLAFQIQDDLLDFDIGNQAFGKPAGQDLRARQLSLSVIEALRNNAPAARSDVNVLRRHVLAFAEGSDDNLAEIVVLIDRLGGFAAARAEADRHLERAAAELERIKAGRNIDQVAEHLETLRTFFGQRRH